MVILQMSGNLPLWACICPPQQSCSWCHLLTALWRVVFSCEFCFYVAKQKMEFLPNVKWHPHPQVTVIPGSETGRSWRKTSVGLERDMFWWGFNLINHTVGILAFCHRSCPQMHFWSSLSQAWWTCVPHKKAKQKQKTDILGITTELAGIDPCSSVVSAPTMATQDSFLLLWILRIAYSAAQQS